MESMWKLSINIGKKKKKKKNVYQPSLYRICQYNLHGIWSMMMYYISTEYWWHLSTDLWMMRLHKNEGSQRAVTTTFHCQRNSSLEPIICCCSPEQSQHTTSSMLPGNGQIAHSKLSTETGNKRSDKAQLWDEKFLELDIVNYVNKNKQQHLTPCFNHCRLS